MRSMSAHSEDSVRVWHYDGVSGVRRQPRLVSHGDEFMLVEGANETGPFAFARLVAHGQLDGRPQFGLRKNHGWRIGLEEDPPASIAAMLPGVRRYGGLIDRFGLLPMILVFAVLSVGALIFIASTPALVAKLIPRSFERQLGEMNLRELGNARCETPEGSAALKALAKRIGARADVDIRVINLPLVNAITIPGDHVLIFSGMLEQAPSADAVAGVLGHELGHVENRDVIEGMIRREGIGIVVRALLGGASSMDSMFGLKSVLDTSFSQSVEARADDYSIDLMVRAHVSTKGTTEFFHRLAAYEAVFGRDLFETHPLSAGREAKFAAVKDQGATPALDPDQWRALRSICVNTPISRLRL